MSGIEHKTETATPPNHGLVRYVAVSLAILLVVAGPVAFGTGDWSPVAAWALTLVPGVVVVSQAARFASSGQSLPFLLYSMAFRVVVSLGGGLLALQLFPALPKTSFLLWLAALYFVALIAETYLTLSINALWMPTRQSPRGSHPSNHLQEAGR